MTSEHDSGHACDPGKEHKVSTLKQRIAELEAVILVHEQWAKQFTSDPENAAVAKVLKENLELKARIIELERERDSTRVFAEKAAALLEAQSVTCAFCGQEYPRGTPRHGDGALAEHIKTCPEHPMRALEQERNELRALLVWTCECGHTNDCAVAKLICARCGRLPSARD